ncbi:MAG: hypothetical protein Q9217_002587 [Psora testacea]
MSAMDPLVRRLTQSTSQPLDVNHAGRSSSLSDIGDHAVNEGLERVVHANDDIEANDTEAETERLENTPLKRRKHQNVVLTAQNRVHSSGTSPLRATLHSMDYSGTGAWLPHDELQQTSDISSLEDSSEGEAQHISTTSPPRKRKRTSLENASMSSQSPPDGNKSPSASSLSPSVTSKAAEATIEESLQDDNAIESEIEDLHTTPLKNKQKSNMRKRKGKMLSITENAQAHTSIGRGSSGDAGDGGEIVYGDEAEIEDAGDAELDNPGKTEEGLIRKKSALDSLSALEKCFATLRDKLFDERLASANEELALLQQPGFVHPELLAMKEAVDQRRNQKIEYQRTRLNYKLQSLQRESVATKHQALSQYMQTVREIRDRSLAQLNREFYQVQRERRNVEGDVPDYMYTFVTRRSQQITQQTAYNNEVSVLSGIAKYVGFPAAPTIKHARPNELHEDMRDMGIALQPPQVLQSTPPPLRTSYSAAAMPGQIPAVDDFLERNAWANPQHSAHQQQRQQMHRDVSNVSRVPTPLSTPAGQRGVIDLTNPHGSGSTVAEPQSGPDSYIVPTSATGDQSKASTSEVNAVQAPTVVASTPSKIAGSLPETTPATAEALEMILSHSRFMNSSKPDQDSSPPDRGYPPTRESHTPTTLPKPLPFTHSAASRASPPVRLSAKVDNVCQPARRSPVPRQFSNPIPAIATGNGQRFRS